MRGDWLVAIAILVLTAAVYSLTWRSARSRLEKQARWASHALRAEDIMSRPVRVITQDGTLGEAAVTMLEAGVGCLPVVDGDGRLIGLITESDLSGAQLLVREPSERVLERATVREQIIEEEYERSATRSVGELMSRRVSTAGPGDPVGDLALRMLEWRIRHLPVVEHGIPIGVVSRRDLLKILAHGAGEAGASVAA